MAKNEKNIQFSIDAKVDEFITELNRLASKFDELKKAWKSVFTLDSNESGDRLVASYEERLERIKAKAQDLKETTDTVAASIRDSVKAMREPVTTLNRALTGVKDVVIFAEQAAKNLGEFKDAVSDVEKVVTSLKTAAQGLNRTQFLNLQHIRNVAENVKRLENAGNILTGLNRGLNNLKSGQERRGDTDVFSKFKESVKDIKEQDYNNTLLTLQTTLDGIKTKLSEGKAPAQEFGTALKVLGDITKKDTNPALDELVKELGKVLDPASDLKKRVDAISSRLGASQAAYERAINGVKAYTQEVANSVAEQIKQAQAQTGSADATDKNTDAVDKQTQAINELTDAQKKQADEQPSKDSFDIGGLAKNISELKTDFSDIIPLLKEAADAMQEFAKECIDVASNVEQTGIRLTVMSQSGITDMNEVRDVIARVSKQTGLSFNELEKGAETLARAGANVKDYLLSAATLAVATGKSIETASYNFGRATQGDARALLALQKQFGITNSELRAYGVAMNENGQVSKQAAQDAMKLKDSMKDLVDTKYGPALAMYSQTLQGTMDATNASMERLQANIGAQIIPGLEYVTRGVARLSNTLSDGSTPIGVITASLGTMVSALLKATTAIAGTVLVLGTLNNKWATVQTAVSGCTEGFKNLASATLTTNANMVTSYITIGALVKWFGILSSAIAIGVIGYQSLNAEIEHQIELQKQLDKESKDSIKDAREREEIIASVVSGGKTTRIQDVGEEYRSGSSLDRLKKYYGIDKIPETAEELAPLIGKVDFSAIDRLASIEERQLKDRLDKRNGQLQQAFEEKQKKLADAIKAKESELENIVVQYQQPGTNKYAVALQDKYAQSELDSLKKQLKELSLSDVDMSGYDKITRAMQTQVDSLRKFANVNRLVGSEAQEIIKAQEKEREKAEKEAEKRRKQAEDNRRKNEQQYAKSYETRLSYIQREMELQISQNNLEGKSKNENLEIVNKTIERVKALKEEYGRIYSQDEDRLRYQENLVKLQEKRKSIEAEIAKEKQKADDAADKERIVEIENEILRIKKEQAGVSVKSLNEQVNILTAAINKYDKILSLDETLSKNARKRREIEEKKLNLVNKRYEIEKKIAQINEDAQKKLQEARQKELETQKSLVEEQMSKYEETGSIANPAYLKLKQKKLMIENQLYQHEIDEVKKEFDDRVKNIDKESEAYNNYHKAMLVQLNSLAEKHQLDLIKEDERLKKVTRQRHDEYSTYSGKSYSSALGDTSATGRGSRNNPNIAALRDNTNAARDLAKTLREGGGFGGGKQQESESLASYNAGLASDALEQLTRNAKAAADALEAVAIKARNSSGNTTNYYDQRRYNNQTTTINGVSKTTSLGNMPDNNGANNPA